MLFEKELIKDYSAPGNKNPSAINCVDKNKKQLIFRGTDKLEALIPILENEDCSIHYATAGLWSTHDLLFHLLKFTGPAEVSFATWSMKEYPVRMLIQGIENGMIEKLNGLVDVRVKVQTPEVFHLVKMHAAKIKVTVCHAKVTVIKNKDWGISIVGSANYTNNPRIEAGVISISKEIAAFHNQWIQEEMNNAHPFK